ncbi:MAG: tetratricopeptide repeat protein [Acidobacteriota bacterium]
MTRSRHRVQGLEAVLLAVLILALAGAGCGAPDAQDQAAEAGPGAAGPSAGAGQEAGVFVPEPDMTGMEERVAERLRATRAAVLASPLSAEAWGEFGKVAHAHELWEEARLAYERAESLDAQNVRWPYFLADVLSVLGTDLEASANAFRRALKLQPDYAPAHMRLGRVLLADDRPQEAAAELERALEIEPGLQPAQVSLAQIQLAEGRLDAAETLLDRILEDAPRHAQALSTLGQVYMRQGRRSEARAMAERARGAAIYNLFSDRLIGEVVVEGVSTVLVWERAKAFYDNGNFEQAALGLEQVVKSAPDNVEARHQLAVALGNIGQAQRSKPHLQKVIALDGEMIDARVQLASIHLDEQNPDAAAPLLQKALDLDPRDPDAGWLLGRAQMMRGEVQPALETFERAHENAERTGSQIQGWAYNEWGSALAQSGRLRRARALFERVLELDPQNAQALFYLGLVSEGEGRRGEAVVFYCRSIEAQPNPPASGRLAALRGTCGS